MLFVLSAPSGAGKTTIARSILQQFATLSFSISATTRARRPKETHGKDYYFLTREDFQQRIDADGLVEWEEIYGNYYGTLKSEVDRVLSEKGQLLFDVDVKGALSIKELYGKDAVLIFIRPPNLDILRDRLTRRGTDSEEVVERRMQRAAWELEQARLFDHEVINDDLAHSVPAVAAIVRKYMSGNQE
jgi:guanylate kinase